MQFDDLGLIEPLLKAVRSEGYITPTPIQLAAIPHVILGKDLVGCAQTGTGKTAAFALPILQLLHAGAFGKKAVATLGARPGVKRSHKSRGPRRRIRAMILSPTRELAAQIGESFRTYGRHTGLRQTVVFGGVGQGPQCKALRDGVDVLVATPGRLLDLLGQGVMHLNDVEIFVLDEADRMLDMGFIHDIRRVIGLLPKRRQTLLFSATMPSQIQTLVDTILSKPVEVRVPTESPAADTVEQAIYFIEQTSKIALLSQLLADPKVTRALVFTRTKHRADRVAKVLSRSDISAEAIHSNKSQNARQRALQHFKDGATRVLVASDIAARGLDVDDISHVINFDLPNEAETYVHRIGRTGRAGAIGLAVSFCCEDQRADLRAIERLLGRPLPVLKHSIKKSATPTGARTGESSAKPGQRRSPKAARTRTKTSGSPEQQQNEFWRRKRKPRTVATPTQFRSRRRGR